MGLRCLLGHDFGDPETERDRTEQGNEVVTTVREVKTCSRCGERQVVSENKEITSIEQLRGTEPGGGTWDASEEAAEATVEDATLEDPSGTPPLDETPEPADVDDHSPMPGTEDHPSVTDLIDDAEDEPDDPVHPGARGDDDADEDVEDDAVIMDDGPEDDESGYTQWHGKDDEEPVTEDDESDEEDAVIMDADEGAASREDVPTEDGSPRDTTIDDYESLTDAAADPDDPPADSPVEADDSPADVAVDAGGSPAEPSGPETDGEHPEGASSEDADEGSGIIMDDEVPAEAGDPETTSPTDQSGPAVDGADPDAGPAGRPLDLDRSTREMELQYYCPECGLTRPVGNSSMRAGDICPECRRGYIQEREKPA